VINKILGGIAVVVVLAMLGVTYMAFFIEKPKAVAKVDKVKGNASVLRDSEVTTLTPDSLIYAADKVLVKNGRATLVFADGTTLIMGDKTTIDVNGYEFDEDANIVTGSLGFVKGAIRVVTGRLTLARNLSVRSNSGTTLGIRGTDVFMGNLESDVIDVLLLESKRGVTVTNKQGKVKLEAAQGTTVTKGEAPTNPKFWPQAKVDKAMAMVQ